MPYSNSKLKSNDDNVNTHILGENINSIMKNKEVLLQAIK